MLDDFPQLIDARNPKINEISTSQHVFECGIRWLWWGGGCYQL